MLKISTIGSKQEESKWCSELDIFAHRNLDGKYKFNHIAKRQENTDNETNNIIVDQLLASDVVIINTGTIDTGMLNYYLGLFYYANRYTTHHIAIIFLQENGKKVGDFNTFDKEEDIIAYINDYLI